MQSRNHQPQIVVSVRQSAATINTKQHSPLSQAELQLKEMKALHDAGLRCKRRERPRMSKQSMYTYSLPDEKSLSPNKFRMPLISRHQRNMSMQYTLNRMDENKNIAHL